MAGGLLSGWPTIPVCQELSQFSPWKFCVLGWLVTLPLLLFQWVGWYIRKDTFDSRVVVLDFFRVPQNPPKNLLNKQIPCVPPQKILVQEVWGGAQTTEFLSTPGYSYAWPKAPSAGLPVPRLLPLHIQHHLELSWESLCPLAAYSTPRPGWRAATSPRSAQRTSNERNSCQEKINSSTQTQTQVQDSRSADSSKESISLWDTREEKEKKRKKPFHCTDMHTDLSSSFPSLA